MGKMFVSLHLLSNLDFENQVKIAKLMSHSIFLHKIMSAGYLLHSHCHCAYWTLFIKL